MGFQLHPTEGEATGDDLVTVDRRVIRKALVAFGGVEMTPLQLSHWHKVADQIGLDKDKDGNRIHIKYEGKK